MQPDDTSLTYLAGTPHQGASDQPPRRVCLLYRGRLAQPSGLGNRVSVVLTGLSNVAEVDVARVFTGADAPMFITGRPRIRRSVHVPAKRAVRSPLRVLRALFDRSLPLQLGGIDLEMERSRLAAALPDHYDAVWCVGEAAVMLAPGVRARRVIYDLVDFSVPMEQAIVRASRRPRDLLMRPVRLMELARRERAIERLAATVDLAVVSARDDASAAPVELMVVPNAYPDPGPPAAAPARPDPPVVLMPGLFRYVPNVDGATWMVREIWPLIRRVHPDARLRLAGRATSVVEALSGHDGVEVVGPVDSMVDEVAAATVVAAPLRFGAGTRVKILEAWAVGTPVVATTVGAAGLGAVHDQHLLIADTAADFAAAVVRLIADAAVGQRLRQAGRVRYDEAFTFERVATQVSTVLTGVLPP